MNQESAAILGGSFVIGCFCIMLGLWGIGPKDILTPYTANSLAAGLAKAACLQDGRNWNYGNCSEAKEK